MLNKTLTGNLENVTLIKFSDIGARVEFNDGSSVYTSVNGSFGEMKPKNGKTVTASYSEKYNTHGKNYVLASAIFYWDTAGKIRANMDVTIPQGTFKFNSAIGNECSIDTENYDDF